jgi:hypothetical protein
MSERAKKNTERRRKEKKLREKENTQESTHSRSSVVSRKLDYKETKNMDSDDYS